MERHASYSCCAVVICQSLLARIHKCEETNRLQSVLHVRRSFLPLDFKSLDELLDSADHALFRVIVPNPHHVLHPLLPPRKKTVYNLRKLTNGLTTVPPVCSSLMRKNFFIRLLYTDVYSHMSVYLYCRLSIFITYRHLVYVCFCHCNIISYCH